MTMTLSPKALPVARILALLPILALLAFVDMGLPHWLGVADATKLTENWMQVHRFLNAVWWLVLGLFLFLVLEVVIWRALRAHHMAPPKLLIDLVRALVFVVAIFGALSAVFDQTLTGLLATSGVVAIVLGFAMQSTLSDLFSGIALNLERPFRVGDWLSLDSGIVGQVVQTNWRATHLRTLDGNDVIVPNSKMAAAQLTNFDQPARYLRQSLTLPIPGDIAPARVQRVLIASAMYCERVMAEPPPRALVAEFQDGKVSYRLDYWIDGYRGEPEIRSEIGAEIWRALDIAGISLIWLGDQAKTAPSPGKDERIEEKRRLQVLENRFKPVTGAERTELDRLLTRVELFRHLDDAHRAAVADVVSQQDVHAGEVIVEQGERSDCLFLLGEGLLEVNVTAPSGERRRINRLCAGHVFGEMALLTGEARSATVRALLPSIVYSIAKQDFLAILREDPELAARLGTILTQRRKATADLLQSIAAQTGAAPPLPHEVDLFERVKGFFGLQ
jgi:small-conductance mechanosensitive channel